MACTSKFGEVACAIALCACGGTAIPEDTGAIPVADAAADAVADAGSDTTVPQLSTIASYCDAFQKAACQFMARCAPSYVDAPVEGCATEVGFKPSFCLRHMLEDIAEPAIAAGRMAYDPVKAQATVDSIASSPCNVSWPATYGPTPLTALVQPSGSCHHDLECTTFCDMNYGCPGRCAAPQGGTCADGLACDHGLQCSGDTCVPIPTGTACQGYDSGPQCGPDDTCQESGGATCGVESPPCTCVPSSPLGTACDTSAKCESGLVCARGACAVNGGEGAPCNLGQLCGHDFTCVVDDAEHGWGWCGKPHALGESCLHSTECVTGRCALPAPPETQGVCADWLAEGAPCMTTVEDWGGCGLGLYCRTADPVTMFLTGACVKRPVETEPCSSNLHQATCWGATLACFGETQAPGTCQRRGAQGDSCQSGPCADGLYCASTGTCASLKPDGASCTLSYECATEFCSIECTLMSGCGSK